jgi:hypothetical protein
MLLFEVGDLIQRRHTGEVGIIVGHTEVRGFSFSSFGIESGYEDMRVRQGSKTQRVPAYKVSTAKGVWIWEHQETRLLRPRPPIEGEECP